MDERSKKLIERKARIYAKKRRDGHPNRQIKYEHTHCCYRITVIT